MFTGLNITILCLWLISAVIDYSAFAAAWQLKEYRLDRFKDFAQSEQGRTLLFGPALLWRAFVLAILVFWPMNGVAELKYVLIFMFALDIGITVRKIQAKTLRRPRWTTKAMIIVLASMLIEGILFLVIGEWIYLLFLAVIRFLIISAVVYAMLFPTTVLKQYFISRATRKISSYKNLLIIGITGSYGKSSTKEFLAHILGGKFSVIKTPKNTNTEIGVAKFIIKNDFSKADIFIVEMGAYTMGEIKLICDMVHPKIGILTTIAEQHLSLFGSKKNIQTAKYELLRSLPKDGLAITNADNEYCREYLHELACTAETFGVEPEYSPTRLIKDIKKTKDGIEYTGLLRGEELAIQAPVIGTHQAFNIAPCILVATHLGMTKQEVQERCKTLPMGHGSIKSFTYGTATILDDSYNSNPAGFKAALDIMSSYPSDRRRVVITRGMLELGDASDAIHEEIGSEIAFMADELVLISRDFLEPIKRGIVEKYKITVCVKDDQKELLRYIKGLKKTNAVVLLENRMPILINKELKSYKK